MRIRAGTLIKTAVSLSLLFYVFERVGWREVLAELADADRALVVLYVLIGLIGTGVSSEKWRVLCRPHGIAVTPVRLFNLYLVGYFFNQILPTSIGGDVVRAYALGRDSGRHVAAMAAVFMERFTGLTALVAFSLLSLLVDWRFVGDPRLAIPLIAVFAGYLVFSWMVFGHGFLAFVERRAPGRRLARLVEKVRNVQRAIHHYRGHPAELGVALGYSAVFYGVAVLNVYVGCLTFGHAVPLWSLVVAVPVMLVLFLVPFSIGGIGLQEWAYFFVLSMVGVPSAVALSLGLMYRARSVGFALVGGALYPLVVSGKPGPAPEAPSSPD